MSDESLEGVARGASTILEVVQEFDRAGYRRAIRGTRRRRNRVLHVSPSDGGQDADTRQLRRLEGASDPDDMLALAALVCAQCGTRGSLLLNYGPSASPEDAGVLDQLEQPPPPPRRLLPGAARRTARVRTTRSCPAPSSRTPHRAPSASMIGNPRPLVASRRRSSAAPPPRLRDLDSHRVVTHDHVHLKFGSGVQDGIGDQFADDEPSIVGPVVVAGRVEHPVAIGAGERWTLDGGLQDHSIQRSPRGMPANRFHACFAG